MTCICSIHLLMRLISLVCLLLPIVLSAVTRQGWGAMVETSSYSLLASSVLLVLKPLTDEGRWPGLVFSGLVILLEILFFLTGFSPVLYVSGCLALMLAHHFLRVAERCSVLRTLFRPQAVWHSLESHSRIFLSYCTGALALTLAASPEDAWVRWPILVLASCLYVLLYYRSFSGRCIMLSRDRERIVKQMIRSASDISEQAVKGEDADDMEKMQDIYGRVLRIMEKNRPFLDADYSLQDMANAAFTNKTYISRTINTISGKNFRQFVNGYRIRYAIELLDGNPRLTVGQLADMSGFNSSVTFSMAFKLNMGETPGEYSIRHRSGLV